MSGYLCLEGDVKLERGSEVTWQSNSRYRHRWRPRGTMVTGIAEIDSGNKEVMGVEGERFIREVFLFN